MLVWFGLARYSSMTGEKASCKLNWAHVDISKRQSETYIYKFLNPHFYRKKNFFGPLQYFKNAIFNWLKLFAKIIWMVWRNETLVLLDNAVIKRALELWDKPQILLFSLKSFIKSIPGIKTDLASSLIRAELCRLVLRLSKVSWNLRKGLED